jgi:hypothetical protein
MFTIRSTSRIRNSELDAQRQRRARRTSRPTRGSSSAIPLLVAAAAVVWSVTLPATPAQATAPSRQTSTASLVAACPEVYLPLGAHHQFSTRLGGRTTFTFRNQGNGWARVQWSSFWSVGDLYVPPNSTAALSRSFAQSPLSVHVWGDKGVYVASDWFC